VQKYGKIFLFILAFLSALGMPQVALAQPPAPRFTQLFCLVWIASPDRGFGA